MQWHKIKSAPMNTKLLLYYPSTHHKDQVFRLGTCIYDRPGFDEPREWHWECDGYSSSEKPTHWAELKFKEERDWSRLIESKIEEGMYINRYRKSDYPPNYFEDDGLIDPRYFWFDRDGKPHKSKKQLHPDDYDIVMEEISYE